MSEEKAAERNWWTCLPCGHKFLREPMEPACTPLCPGCGARDTQPGRLGRPEIVTWVDARSDDGWTEQDAPDMRIAEITSLGHVVEETKEVLCIASSVDARTGQLSGIMFIPKQCILARKEALEPLRQMAPEDTDHLPSFGSQIGPLKLRHLSEPQPEIVFWTPTKAPGGVPFCYVLAHWRRYLDRPGGLGLEWDLSFCGDLPFAPGVNRQDFWKLAKEGQVWLTENRGGE